MSKAIARLNGGGLRERKKADTRERILNSASLLFSQNGYESTSIESIAADADISATTLYNYFGTKGQILLSMIARSDDELLARESERHLDPGTEVVSYIVGFLTRLTRHSLTRIDRSTWRYAMAHSLVNDGSDDIKEQYTSINAELLKHIVRILSHINPKKPAKERGDATKLGEMIFDLYRILFMRLISTDETKFDSYKESLRRYVTAAIRSEQDFT